LAQNAIELEALTKTYAPSGGEPAKTALNSIDLAIPKGTIFGLLGPNGAGKSTLINILAGLVTKTSGSVQIWGWDQDVNPRQSRASIGVMPQELNIDPFFSPRAALEVQAGLYGVPTNARRTEDILGMIGLRDKAEAYARTLSGGMRRRLLLGKALVHRPPILVLDEPTAGVDIELRQMLWENVRRLNAEGMTIILTTHYLEEAQEMCDEVAIINHGNVVARDTTAALLGRVDAKTLVVHGDDPIPADISLPAGCEAVSRKDGGLAITYHRSLTSPDDILGALRAADVRLKDVATEEADLEDVFLELTRSRGSADECDAPERT
jgi:ABC-2 type transport system ATP-binding protein